MGPGWSGSRWGRDIEKSVNRRLASMQLLVGFCGVLAIGKIPKTACCVKRACAAQ